MLEWYGDFWSERRKELLHEAESRRSMRRAVSGRQRSPSQSHAQRARKGESCAWLRQLHARLGS
jgi:hypothetical protein